MGSEIRASSKVAQLGFWTLADICENGLQESVINDFEVYLLVSWLLVLLKRGIGDNPMKDLDLQKVRWANVVFWKCIKWKNPFLPQKDWFGTFTWRKSVDVAEQRGPFTHVSIVLSTCLAPTSLFIQYLSCCFVRGRLCWVKFILGLKS